MTETDPKFEFTARNSAILQVVVCSRIATVDALLDLISDLSWVEAGEVAVVHPSLPQLAREDLKLYLTILQAALERRTAEDEPHLRVIFSSNDERIVKTLLSDFVSVQGM